MVHDLEEMLAYAQCRNSLINYTRNTGKSYCKSNSVEDIAGEISNSHFTLDN